MTPCPSCGSSDYKVYRPWQKYCGKKCANKERAKRYLERKVKAYYQGQGPEHSEP